MWILVVVACWTEGPQDRCAPTVPPFYFASEAECQSVMPEVLRAVVATGPRWVAIECKATATSQG